MNALKGKGKNFSTNNAKKTRRDSDFYETPYSITKHLLENETFDFSRRILEPASGGGAIVKILEKYWDADLISSYDVETNFLTETRSVPYIITNPPFSLAHEFIIQAKRIASLKFAFLLPLSYLHGKKRFDEIYTDTSYGLKTVYVFTRYPMLGQPLREDGKYNTGMMVYAWYVFENLYAGQPCIKWIDNNSDVLSKKDAALNINTTCQSFTF